MTVKAIFPHSELSYWLNIAELLRDRYGWDICYFAGIDDFRIKEAQEKFPDAVFHSIEQIKRGQIPYKCEKIKNAFLDEDLLSALAFHESIFIKMMDRHNIDGKLTYQKRIFYYHTQLMYWKGVLDYFKPDVLVFRVAPHRGYDYILYALCRVLGIKTMMFERTSLPGRIYPVESFETGSEMIRDAYRKRLKDNNDNEIILSQKTRDHIERLTQSYSQAMPFHLKYKLTKFKQGVLETLILISKDVIKGLLLRSKDPGYLRKSFYKNMGLFKRKRLLSRYNSLAKEVDMKKPYIFVALQCEPERQTCPNGGVFGNQYVMIDLLSKLVPEGWMIYVKEHVSQFKPYQAPERSKTVQFYDYIANMPNVEFVPLSYTSFDMIDGAKASATVSGTVAWESVVRAKPALLFGYSWYRDGEGIFVTHNAHKCRRAIEKIENGYVVDREKVLLFAQVIEENSFKGYIDKLYDKMKIVTLDENVANMSMSIARFYEEAAGREKRAVLE
ncbi:MAG: hypothetical protein JRJ86_08625 [Deltaproteobacteria bacterium]|nr:hypothetical protein [Deltaproteobacteria bacterium]MBW2342556.1 hypothetical protein [Deltaproteobacteria bacterium]